MYIYVLLFFYCGLTIFSSWAGGKLPMRFAAAHSIMQTLVSFVGGLMLGVGLLHLIPHATIEIGSLDTAMYWALAGMLCMFFLLRIFHFHEHGPFELHDDSEIDSECGACEHHHHEEVAHAHRFSWPGVAFGLMLHSLIDGIALGVAVYTDSKHGTSWSFYGLGVFLAVVLHKPLDAMAVTILMAAAGSSRKTQTTMNWLFAIVCPIGTLLAVFGLGQLGQWQHAVLGAGLAFAGGVFVSIALTDLLPELKLHSHDRFKLSMALLGGVLLSILIGTVEPSHLHPGNMPHEVHQQHEEHDKGDVEP